MPLKNQNKRWWVLCPLLAGAFLLLVFGEREPVAASAGSVVAPRGALAAFMPSTLSNSGRTPESSERPLLVPRNQLVRASESIRIRDLFSLQSWVATNQMSLALTLEPPSPVAPPLPFVYVGKKQESGKWEVYLGIGEKTLVAREGDLLEGRYRVQSVLPPQMELLFEPLGQVQNLTIGDS